MGNECYRCDECKFLSCYQYFGLMIFDKTPLRLKAVNFIHEIDQKSNTLMQMTAENTKKQSKPIQCKIKMEIKMEITNGQHIVTKSYSILAPARRDESKAVYKHASFPLNVNKLEKELI